MENNETKDFSFDTSKPFDYWLKKKDNPIIYCLLIMDGKDFLVKNSYEVELTQKTADHDTFTISVPDDALDTFEGYVMENSKNLFGKNITIIYHRYGEVKQTFTGIIFDIKNKKDNGSGYGKLCITGYSPSILLENGKDCQSFEDKALVQIIKEVTEFYPQEAKIAISSNCLNEANNRPLPYTVQYKESDYQFIRRLAIRHGEFFYFNGENLVFGNKVEPIIRLEQGVDLMSIEFEMKIGTQDFKFTGYDVQSGAKIEKDSSNIQSEFKESLFQSIAINISKKIFRKKSKMYFNHTGISQSSESELKESVRLEKERRENLIEIRGKSRNPELRIGGRAELIDINAKPMETYRIIEIKHYHSGNQYYNEFVGIPDFFNASPYIDIEAVPQGEEQPARVMDNNDPMGMGRVRVQFPWQEEKNQMTPWIRTTTIYAGAGRGDYKIPEIGDEVLVKHESGNAEKPYVSGAMYNGAKTAGFHTPNNDLKVERTRSGVQEFINDAEGSWKQSTPDGNYFLQDGKGNAVMNVPNNLTFNIGGNFNVNVGKNLSFLVGMRAIYNIGLQMMMNTPILKYFIADNYHLQSPKTLINGEGEIKIEAKETNVAGMQKLMIHSDESTVINSKGLVEVKGDDGTSNDNTPLNYAPTETIVKAKAVVVFRPMSTWNGEFLFDFMRLGSGTTLGQTSVVGDVDYSTLVGYYRDNDYVSAPFVGDTRDANRNGVKDLYEKLKNEYDKYSFSQKLDANNKPYEYLAPILGLYKNENETEKAIAILELQIEVQEKPDELILEYDKNYFEITQHVDPNGVVVTGRASTPANAPTPYTNPNPNMKKFKLSRSVTGAGSFNTENIQIECIAPFNTPQKIMAYTIMANPDPTKTEKIKEIAGVLNVLPNDRSKRKVKKVVMVNVMTDIDSNPRTNEQGFFAGESNELEQKNIIRKILRQALIDPILKVETLDLTSTGKPNTTIRDNFNRKYVTGGRFKCYYLSNTNQPAGWQDLSEYLYQKLKAQTGIGNKYDSYIRVFYLPAEGYAIDKLGHEFPALANGNLGGYTDGTHPQNIVMLSTADKNSVAHELLHSLRLAHTFESKNHIKAGVNDPTALNGKHSFKAKSTENIMDYGDRNKQYFLFNWQAKIANGNATAEPANYIPETFTQTVTNIP